MRSRLAALVTAGLAAVGTAAALLVGGPSAAGSGGPEADHQRGLTRIHGSVGSGFVISVTPRRVPPGTYRFVVTDNSSMHNWHIIGPGVNRKTRVAFVGTRRFTLELTAGTYRIRCDPHRTTMRTRLRVVA
jgi:plastocyanin